MGKVLYAIAAADGKIHPAEVARLRSVVREEVVPVESSHDQFGTDNAYYVEFEFETLADRDFPAADAYHSFKAYVKEFEGKIDPVMKQTCLNAARKVAEAVRGVNRAESAYLADLESLIG